MLDDGERTAEHITYCTHDVQIYRIIGQVWFCLCIRDHDDALWKQSCRRYRLDITIAARIIYLFIHIHMYGVVEADVGANEWNRRLATLIIVAEKQKHTEKKCFKTRSKGIIL